MQIGVGFYVGAGVLKGPRSTHCECGRKFTAKDISGGRCHGCGRMVLPVERVNTFVECGCCGAYHRTDFAGDCREDSERYWDLPDNAEVVYLDDESNDDELIECDCGASHYPDFEGH